jgi:hypothetical protein
LFFSGKTAIPMNRYGDGIRRAEIGLSGIYAVKSALNESRIAFPALLWSLL